MLLVVDVVTKLCMIAPYERWTVGATICFMNVLSLLSYLHR